MVNSVTLNYFFSSIAGLEKRTKSPPISQTSLKMQPTRSPHLLRKFPVSQVVLLTAHPTVYPESPSVP